MSNEQACVVLLVFGTASVMYPVMMMLLKMVNKERTE